VCSFARVFDEQRNGRRLRHRRILEAPANLDARTRNGRVFREISQRSLDRRCANRVDSAHIHFGPRLIGDHVVYRATPITSAFTVTPGTKPFN
jgi:hypothetical protein